MGRIVPKLVANRTRDSGARRRVGLDALRRAAVQQTHWQNSWRYASALHRFSIVDSDETAEREALHWATICVDDASSNAVTALQLAALYSPSVVGAAIPIDSLGLAFAPAPELLTPIGPAKAPKPVEPVSGSGNTDTHASLRAWYWLTQSTQFMENTPLPDQLTSWKDIHSTLWMLLPPAFRTSLIKRTGRVSFSGVEHAEAIFAARALGSLSDAEFCSHSAYQLWLNMCAGVAGSFGSLLNLTSSRDVARHTRRNDARLALLRAAEQDQYPAAQFAVGIDKGMLPPSASPASKIVASGSGTGGAASAGAAVATSDGSLPKITRARQWEFLERAAAQGHLQSLLCLRDFHTAGVKDYKPLQDGDAASSFVPNRELLEWGAEVGVKPSAEGALEFALRLACLGHRPSAICAGNLLWHFNRSRSGVSSSLLSDAGAERAMRWLAHGAVPSADLAMTGVGGGGANVLSAPIATGYEARASVFIQRAEAASASGGDVLSEYGAARAELTTAVKLDGHTPSSVDRLKSVEKMIENAESLFAETANKILK